MLDALVDQVFQRHRCPGESDQALIARLRIADSRLPALYRNHTVDADHAYADSLIRAAYMLRYLPNYTLQLGDILKDLEGEPGVAATLMTPELRHVALCGGPAPEAIALAVLHQQAGGRHLQTTVLDKQVPHWADCWPATAAVAQAFSSHPAVAIRGEPLDLGSRTLQGEALLRTCHVLSLMNAFNELIRLGEPTLRRALRVRLSALPAGCLVLASDQANYPACESGMALLAEELQRIGARLLISRISKARAREIRNEFSMVPRLRSLYGQPGGPEGPKTNHYRINMATLQLAALLPRQKA